MRLTHEGPTAEIIDSEYVELKFIFDRRQSFFSLSFFLFLFLSLLLLLSSAAASAVIWGASFMLRLRLIA